MRSGEPKIGEQLGSYRLESVLGRGGMASVFLASHTTLARKAAVKVLSQATALDEGSYRRFIAEARIISEIEHPGVVHILDVIEQQEPLRIAYVMEHIDGPTLRRELDRRPLKPVEVARLGLQLTEALRAIHARQVVHRDLKPSNVLLTGRVDGPTFPLAKLADFGIAKAQDRPAPHKTATGLIIGTPTYMAPEQVSGEPIGPATDIYALGELLYEMFTGKRVFPEDQRTSLRMKLDPHPPPLEPLPFPDSGPIWDLIRACLDPQALRRPSHDVIVEVLQTIDAAPVPVAFLSPERATQLQHTATFAGPLLGEPPLEPAVEGRPVRIDPVTAPGLLPSVEVPRPPPITAPWWPLAVGGLALAAALGLAGWVLTQSPEAPEPATEAAVPAPTSPPVEQTAAPAPSRAKPPTPARAYAAEPTTPAPEPARLLFSIDSTPSGARVLDADTGLELGVTPLRLEIVDGATRVVKLIKTGHLPRTLEVDGLANVRIRLKRKAVKRRRAKTKKPPRKPAPKPSDEDLMPW